MGSGPEIKGEKGAKKRRGGGCLWDRIVHHVRRVGGLDRIIDCPNKRRPPSHGEHFESQDDPRLPFEEQRVSRRRMLRATCNSM